MVAKFSSTGGQDWWVGVAVVTLPGGGCRHYSGLHASCQRHDEPGPRLGPALSNSVPLAEHIKLEKVAHNNLQLALHKELQKTAKLQYDHSWRQAGQEDSFSPPPSLPLLPPGKSKPRDSNFHIR